MMSSQAITDTPPTKGRISPVRKIAAVIFSTTVFSLGLVAPAAAQNVETLLQNVLDIMTGNAARLLAVIACVVLGILAMFGAFDFRRMATVVIGIIVVFGSAEIVDLLTA
jgi:type IV secretion system protein VirB2